MRRTPGLLALLLSLGACSRPAAVGDGGNSGPKPPAVPPIAATAAPLVDPPREDGAAHPTAVAMSSTHSCARFSDDSLRCWGDNSFGELGNGDGITQVGVVSAKIDGVVDVAVGYGVTCARRRDHSLRCWGANHNGSIDPNDAETTRVAPLPIAGVDSVRAVGIDNYSGCAITLEGAVRCWGTLDQIAQKKVAPTPVGALNALVHVAVSTNESCAVRSDGALFCWGGNAGTSIDRPKRVPLEGVTDVVLGGSGGCAILAGGKVACWGENDSGQIGEGAPQSVAIDAPRD